jgi:hypothetical protein
MHRRKRYTAELPVFYRRSNDAIKISFSVKKNCRYLPVYVRCTSVCKDR